MEEKMAINLPPLPYKPNALEPYITENTLGFHHGKHHNGYVVNLNNLLEDKDQKDLSLEEIIMWSAKSPSLLPIFNNAAQVWNHTFYWNSMCPNGGGKPVGDIANQIQKDFSSYEEFCVQFKQAAASQFGSGWAWLVFDGQKLSIIKTSNADLPLVHGLKAILTCDVWEHAYYLDYQNRRPDYVTTFLDHLVNWDFANKNFMSGN